MQLPPLNFLDINLLLAVNTIILLITVELVSPNYGLTNLAINKNKLRKITLTTSILFLATVTIRIINIITNS